MTAHKTAAPDVAADVAAALDVTGLSHRFGTRVALEHVSFTVAAGAFTVLLGLNGAGKTTLLSLITGLYHARSGAIAIFGHGLRRAPLAALREIGVVFQQPTLDPDLTVGENLRYHAALHGLSKREAEVRLQAELTRMDVLDRLGERVRTLSGGLRRRVEIARALLHEPRLLVLDEPTVGLDLANRRAIQAHIRHLCAERGLAVLWATHLMDEVQPGDALVVLHQGVVVWRGQADALPCATGTASVADGFLRLTQAPA
jgi:ABC-2 type transport system ATP-binding protein